MIKQTKQILIVPLTLLASAAAFAQVNASSQITNTTNATSAAASGAVNSAANASANAANAGASVGASTANAANTVNGAINAGASTTAGNAGVSTSVRTPGVSANTHTDFAISPSVDVSGMVQTVNSTEFAARDQLVTNVNTQFEATQSQLDRVEKEGKRLEGAAKENFKASVANAKMKEKELKNSIKAAKKSSADTWTSTRSELASNYDAYVQAVAKADAAAMGGGSVSAR